MGTCDFSGMDNGLERPGLVGARGKLGRKGYVQYFLADIGQIAFAHAQRIRPFINEESARTVVTTFNNR